MSKILNECKIWGWLSDFWPEQQSGWSCHLGRRNGLEALEEHDLCVGQVTFEMMTETPWEIPCWHLDGQVWAQKVPFWHLFSIGVMRQGHHWSGEGAGEEASHQGPLHSHLLTPQGIFVESCQALSCPWFSANDPTCFLSNRQGTVSASASAQRPPESVLWSLWRDLFLANRMALAVWAGQKWSSFRPLFHCFRLWEPHSASVLTLSLWRGCLYHQRLEFEPKARLMVGEGAVTFTGEWKKGVWGVAGPGRCSLCGPVWSSLEFSLLRAHVRSGSWELADQAPVGSPSSVIYHWSDLGAPAWAFYGVNQSCLEVRCA